MLPEGLSLFKDVFTPAESTGILDEIRADSLRPDCGRMVRKYHDKAVEPRFHSSWDDPTTNGFPGYGKMVVSRITERGISRGGSYRMIANLYASQEAAAAHIDRVYMGIRDVVIAVSFGSARIMRIAHAPSGQIWDIDVPPCSALRFSGFSRFHCSHAILPGIDQRASLIFRFQERE